MQSLRQLGKKNSWNVQRLTHSNSQRDEEEEQQLLPPAAAQTPGDASTEAMGHQISGGDQPVIDEAMPGSKVESTSHEEKSEETKQHLADEHQQDFSTPSASVLKATDSGSRQSNSQTTSQHAADEESPCATLGMVLNSNGDVSTASYVEKKKRKRKDE